MADQSEFRSIGIMAKFGNAFAKAGGSLDDLNRIADSRALLRQIVGLVHPEQSVQPVAIEHNQHGHIILDIVGLDLSGAMEVERLTAAGYRISDYAKSCLTSTRSDSYDAKHRLTAGQSYKIALVPGTEIPKNSERMTANLRILGAKYGYEKPLAGIVPRIRESVSDEQLKEWRIWYIAALHEPIKDADGDPFVLSAGRRGVGRWVGAYWGRPGSRWFAECLFAFGVPASA